ncbi:hypothetical protein AUJ14_00085 [Candidatus Micrarchaeota archaeon CG1_02_55_22]|nr:MAG: hypothetical protein AUJ14_00085 [Candidatus Micrarchaeota archaeon CG1_02_55_22]
MDLFFVMRVLLALFVVVFVVAVFSGVAAPVQLSNESFELSLPTAPFNVSPDLSQGNYYSPDEFVNRSVPDSARVCLYGENKEWLYSGFFSSINVFGKQVALDSFWFNSSVSPASFVDCAAVVLFDDSQGEFMERGQRSGVAEAFHRGAGVIVEKRAASRMRSDESVLGYMPVLDAFIPIKLDAPGNDAEFLGERVFSGVFVPVSDDASTVSLVGLGFSGNVTVVLQTGGEALAWLKDESFAPSKPAYPAIIRSRQLNANSVYYYSFPLVSAQDSLRAVVRMQVEEYLTTLAFLRIRAAG